MAASSNMPSIEYSQPPRVRAINWCAIASFLLGLPAFTLPWPTLTLLRTVFGEPPSEFVLDTTGLTTALLIYLLAALASVGLGIRAMPETGPEPAAERGFAFAFIGMAFGVLAVVGNGAGLLLIGWSH